jgi:hypothetical protein
MVNLLKVSVLSLLFFFSTELQLVAQRPAAKKKTTTSKKKTDDYFNEKGGFKHRLWYGGSFVLNGGTDQQFDPSTGGAFEISQFTVGVTPMVGYKIIGGLSAGPRVGYNLTTYRIKDPISVDIIKTTLHDYSLGVFARYKFLQTFFVQTDYEYASTSSVSLSRDTNRKLIATKIREDRDNFYGGLGYNGGGLVGYEVALMYNFLAPENSPNIPITFRIGFTYNF